MSTTLLNIPHPKLRYPKWVTELPHNTLNIGLTGGIGSGKSTVAKLLRERGAALVDLDGISHALTQANGRAMPQIVASFGALAAMPSGALNRAQMRAWVFQDIQVKRKLENILHPMIAQDAIERAHQLAKRVPHTCLIFDIPLLAESEFWMDRFDWIVVVECARQTQIQRVKIRNPNLSIVEIESIIDAQTPAIERRKIANVLINNDKHEQNHLNIGIQVDILSHHLGLLHKSIELIRK